MELVLLMLFKGKSNETRAINMAEDAQKIALQQLGEGVKVKISVSLEVFVSGQTEQLPTFILYSSIPEEFSDDEQLMEFHKTVLTRLADLAYSSERVGHQINICGAVFSMTSQGNRSAAVAE